MRVAKKASNMSAIKQVRCHAETHKFPVGNDLYLRNRTGIEDTSAHLIFTPQELTGPKAGIHAVRVTRN